MPGRGQRHDLGVRLARALVPALADYALALSDHAADARIRVGGPQAAARELEGPRHVAGVIRSAGPSSLAARIARLRRQERHLAGRRVAAPALVELLELVAE